KAIARLGNSGDLRSIKLLISTLAGLKNLTENNRLKSDIISVLGESPHPEALEAVVELACNIQPHGIDYYRNNYSEIANAAGILRYNQNLRAATAMIRKFAQLNKPPDHWLFAIRFVLGRVESWGAPSRNFRPPLDRGMPPETDAANVLWSLALDWL